MLQSVRAGAATRGAAVGLLAGPAGASAPSSVQAPDTRPAPTFAQLIRDMGRRTAAGRGARIAMVRNSRSDRRAALLTLARLRRSLSPGHDAADLIERLQRRIRFAGVAGGQ